MSWVEVAGIVLICLGLIGGGALVAQRPSFWVEFGGRIITALTPIIWKFVSKRMTPEEEAKWRHEQITSANPPGMKSKFPRRDK